MLTKNLTPFFFGTRLTSRKPPAPEMTMVVRGTFRIEDDALVPIEGIDQGFMSGDVYAESDDEREGELLYADDFADFKLNAEVLLRGSCHAPGDKPVTECPVRIGLGDWSKGLRVVGRRVWSGETSWTDPIPFRSAPLGYAHAFGGPGHAANPAGKGLGDELPTVEAIDAPITRRSQRPAPAGFGPINPMWPGRKGKRGTQYGADWKAKRAPYYAADFDWSFFSAAPADQQLSGYLRGDERLRLDNLLEGRPRVDVPLPGLRVRAFVRREAATFDEITMSLDTVFVDSDEGVVYLTWRGVAAVAEPDFIDVEACLVASEPLGEARPSDHYEQVLEAYLADPTGVLAALPKELQELAARDREARLGKLAEAPPPGVDPISHELDQKFGPLLPDDVKARVQGGMEQAHADAPPEADLSGAISKALKEQKPAAPTAETIKPGAMPDMGLKRQMRELMERTAALKEALAQQQAEAPELPEGRSMPEVPPEKIAELEAVPHDPKLKELDPTYEVPEPLPTDAPGPGADLHERDFSDANLAGVDLSGANLERTVLTRANLRGANLSGANLSRAILYGANLEGADLRGANLTCVNAAEANFDGAKLDEATLEQGYLKAVSLRGASLKKARGEYVILDQADLSDADLGAAAFERSHLQEATLDRSRWAGATLKRCLLADAKGDAVDLSEADLEEVRFIDATLTGARVARARLAASIWRGSRIDGADFTEVDAPGAFFDSASAKGAIFFRADLAEARFYRTNLEGAQLVEANLFKADFQRANLTRASAGGANLYDAKMLEAKTEGLSLSGANTKMLRREPG